MRAVKTNKVFVSAQSNRQPADRNESRHRHAVDVLRREGVAFQELDGCWQGAREKTLVLCATDVRSHEENMELAINLARLFDQEAVLEVTNDDQATLYTLTNGLWPQKVGRFVEVTEAEALARTSYTRDADGRYFSVVG